MTKRNLHWASVLMLGASLMVVPVGATGDDKELSGKLLEKRFEKGAVQYDYLLLLPADHGKSDKPAPLLLFLHGKGQKLAGLKRYGVTKQLERKADNPFILVAPENPDKFWKAASLNALLDEIVAKYQVDRDRVYVTGLSMGGFGTWSLLAAAPERFAAAIPICGGGNPGIAGKIKDLPIWVFHGAKDDVVKASYSERMVQALKDAGAEKVKFTLYPDAKHDAWTATYNNPEVWDWLLKQKRVSKKE